MKQSNMEFYLIYTHKRTNINSIAVHVNLFTKHTCAQELAMAILFNTLKHCVKIPL